MATSPSSPTAPPSSATCGYSLTSGSFQPFWGLQLPASPDEDPAWLNLNSRSPANLRRLWYNLCGLDTTYTPLPESP